MLPSVLGSNLGTGSHLTCLLLALEIITYALNCNAMDTEKVVTNVITKGEKTWNRHQ